MNTRLFKWLLTVTALFCLSFIATNVTAKKPVKPTPGNGGAACVDSVSYFPAFAYVEYFRPKKKQSAFNIYLSNAEGDCTVAVYSGELGPNGPVISYRYFDHGDGTGTGKIVWAKNADNYGDDPPLPVIRMIEFRVADQVITETLPLSSELLLRGTQSPYGGWQGNVATPDLAPAGDKLVFYGYEDYVNFYLSELNFTICAIPPCTERFLEAGEGEPHATDPKYSLSTGRLYIKLQPYDDELRRFAFIDKIGETWSEPHIVWQYPDPIWHLNVGLWDYDNDEYSEEVVAVSTGSGPDYFIDVWGCFGPNENPCLVLTVPGRDATIKSLDGHPSLLYRYIYTNNGSPAIFEYDLVNGTTRMVIDTTSGRFSGISTVDAAD